MLTNLMQSCYMKALLSHNHVQCYTVMVMHGQIVCMSICFMHFTGGISFVLLRLLYRLYGLLVMCGSIAAAGTNAVSAAGL